MSRFTRPLRVSPVPPKGAEWCLLESFGYDVEFEGNDKTVEVPRGFVTDFASIPRLFWLLLPKWGSYGNAAVLHDFLYWEQDRWRGLGEVVTRKKADQIMLEAMVWLKVPFWQKWPIYGALRVGGWVAWWTNKMNRRSGFRRFMEPDELTAEYRHNKRRGLLKEVVARVKSGKQESGPPPPSLSRFSQEFTKVVAPPVLDRALGRRPSHCEDDRVRAGELSADKLLAAELRADDLRDALTELDNVEERRDVCRAELKRLRRELANRIDRTRPPSKAPERHEDEVRDELEKKKRELEDFTGEIESCERKIEEERRDGIIAALLGLADATRQALDEDRSVGFTLALATDRVHSLLEPILRATIRDEKERDEVVACAGMLIEAVGALVNRRLQDPPLQDPPPRPVTSAGLGHGLVCSWPGGQGEVESEFLSTAEMVLPHYNKNQDSLSWIREQLDKFPRREGAKDNLDKIEKLLGTGKGLQVAKAWRLLDETTDLNTSVIEVGGDLRSAGVGAMKTELESAGLSQVLQAWALLARGSGAGEGETAERRVAARTADLRLRIARQIAAKLGFKPEPSERGESSRRMAFVEKIATSRLLVDQAEELLDKDDLMQFQDRRSDLEQRAAKRARRDRGALWWVLLPLAPAIWLLLRGSMKSLRQFFAIGVEADAPAPPVYQQLGTMARTVLLWAGCGYGLLTLLSVARLFWQLEPVAAEATNLWLVGFVGVNFLGCSLYLIWQARSIHLPGGKGS